MLDKIVIHASVSLFAISPVSPFPEPTNCTTLTSCPLTSCLAARKMKRFPLKCDSMDALRVSKYNNMKIILDTLVVF